MRHLALSVGLACALSAGAATESLQTAMAACLAEQSKQAPFSGGVAAGVGSTRFRQASRFADAQGQVPNTHSTPFRLASVGKVLTQVAIGRLVDAGKLRLDDSARRHLPELPESFASITISQLLQHRSGVAPMTRPDMADGPLMAGAKTARDLVTLVAAKPLSFEPGSQDQYSNGGYLLLGAVIEAASGQAYRAYVEWQVFAPVGMNASSFEPGPTAAVPLTRLTAPGQPLAATPQPRIEFAAMKASSAGDGLSSAADLEALAMALLGDQLLTAATKAAIFSHRVWPWRLGQTGGAAGSNTGFWVFPERDAWLVVLSNFDPPAGELMGQALNEVLAGQPCKVQAPRGLPLPRSGSPG